MFSYFKNCYSDMSLNAKRERWGGSIVLVAETHDIHRTITDIFQLCFPSTIFPPPILGEGGNCSSTSHLFFLNVFLGGQNSERYLLHPKPSEVVLYLKNGNQFPHLLVLSASTCVIVRHWR